MTTPTTTTPETGSTPGEIDLDWLKTTKLPVVTRMQTAQLFGVDERTITRAIDNGDLPCVRVGRRSLIPVPELRRLLGLPEA